MVFISGKHIYYRLHYFFLCCLWISHTWSNSVVVLDIKILPQWCSKKFDCGGKGAIGYF